MSVRKESDKAVNWSAISAGGIFAEHSRQSMLEQQQEMQRQYLALQQQRLMEEQRRQAELLLQQQQLYEQRLLEQQKALQLEEQRKQMEAELLRQQYEEALQRQRLAEQERQLQEQERHLAIQRQQELLRAQQLAIQKQKLEHEQRQREIAEMERQAALKAEAARLQQQLEAQRLEAERRAEEERRMAAEQAERERLAQKQREQAELERLARMQEQLEAEARRKQQEIEQAAVEAQRRAEQHKRALEAAQLEAARLEEEHRRQLAARAEQERQYAAAMEKQRQEEEAARLEQERLRQEREAEKERRRREREERERDALRRAMQLHGPRSKQNLSRQEILNQRKMLIAQGLLDPNAPYDLDDGLASSAGATAGGDSIFSKLAALSDDGSSGSVAADVSAQRPVSAVTAQQLSSSALQSYLPSTTRTPPNSPATSTTRRADAPLAGFDVVFTTTSPTRADDFVPSSSSLSSSSSLPMPVQLPKPFQSGVDNTFLAPEFLDQSKEDLPPRPAENTHEVTVSAGMLMIDAYPMPAAANNPFIDPPSPPQQQQPPVSDVLSLARVFNSYQAEDPSELTIAEGETVEVLHKFANGWWVGRNALGATGTFPSNFVEELPAAVSSPPPTDHADLFTPAAGPPTPFSPPVSLAASSSSPASSSSSSSLAALPPGQRTDSSLEILFSNNTAAPKSSAPASDSLAEMLAGLKFADEEQAKRTKVIFEILDSERSYVHGLQTLAQVYMDPLLLSLKTSKPIVKERDLKAIFPHVTVILSHNQIFLKELEERVAQINESAPARLGDLFLRLKDHLHAYSSYVNSYPQANNTLQALMKSNSKLVQFLNQAKTNPACNSWDLPTFLILPIQRVPRYILLVQELLKYTPPEHVDYNDLVAALVSLRDIADLINESKRDAENLPEVLRVYNAVEPRIPNLVEPHRRFVMEGMVYELKKKHLKQRYLFLFNDLLLLTDRKIKREKKATPMSSGTFSSRLVASIPLGNANLDTSSELKGWKFPAEATEMLPNAFILHASKSSYLFFAPMPAKKTEWIASLTKSIQFAAARTKSLGL